jgi:hypothetical protein
MLLLTLLALSATLATALPELPMRARGGKLHADREALAAASDAAAGILRNSTPNWFTQKVWHNGSAATFQQRYYIDTASWSGRRLRTFSSTLAARAR